MQTLFNWPGGATFVLTIGNLKIACDPVLCSKGTVQDFFWFKSERLEQPVYSEETFRDVDLWLITHKHLDHLDDKGLEQIKPNTKVVCNPNSAPILKRNGNNNLTILQWKQTTSFQLKGYDIEVVAIPAIHGINPLSAFFAGQVNGYYLTIKHLEETLNFYITSDTVYKKSIVNALKDRKIDYMIANMGAAKQGSWIMTLTLNAKMLSKLIQKLQPKWVIPVHYGTFKHYREPADKIRELHDDRILWVKVGDEKRI